MTPTRRSIALFALLLSATLGFGTAFRTVTAHGQTCTNPDDCNGNGASGGDGGCGGGMCSGSGGGGGNSPGQTGEPSGGGNTSGQGGTGGPGNGSNGDAGANNIRTPTPPPDTGGDLSSSGSGTTAARTSSSSTAATPAPDASLQSWAKQLGTTSDEVASWFGTYGADDSIGGRANAVTLHPDDQLTIFDGASGADAGAGDSPPRVGIRGVADTKTQGGDGVDVSMHSDAVPLGSTVTDAGGAFTANVRIPHDASGGHHFVVALAPNTKGGRVAFVYPVDVEAAAAAAPAADNSAQSTPASKHFPWLALEAILGTLSVVALFVYRVRRATAGA
jgi:hypothetical protein